jgi:hypothetical protein
LLARELAAAAAKDKAGRDGCDRRRSRIDDARKSGDWTVGWARRNKGEGGWWMHACFGGDGREVGSEEPGEGISHGPSYRRKGRIVGGINDGLAQVEEGNRKDGRRE